MLWYADLMVTMRILDRKHVALLSTGHDCKLVDEMKRLTECHFIRKILTIGQ